MPRTTLPLLASVAAALLVLAADAHALRPGELPPLSPPFDVRITAGGQSPAWYTIASDARGGAFITWERWDEHGFSIRLQHLLPWGDVAWERNGRSLSAIRDVQTDPVVVADGSGGAIVTWDDFRSSKDHIYAQRVDARGRVLWTDGGVQVSTLPGYYGRPCPDDAGGAFIAWVDDSGIYWIQHLDANGAMARGWRGPVRLGGVGDNSNLAHCLPDGHGGVFVAWSTGVGFAQQVYLQHVSATGATLWGSGGIPVTRGTQWQGGVLMIPDDRGGVLLAWQVQRGPGDGIACDRYDSTGVHWWGTLAVVGPDSDRHSLRALCSDGTGGAYLAWSDGRDGVTRAYVQHIDRDGGTPWPRGGLPVATSGVTQNVGGAVADGRGGVWVLWSETPDWLGLGAIAMQHLLSNGRPARGWPARGRVLTTAPGTRGGAIAQPAGAGLNVVWKDTRDAMYGDLYARHVSGEEAWDVLDEAAHAPGTAPGGTPPTATLSVRRLASGTGLEVVTPVTSAGTLSLTVSDIAGRVVCRATAPATPGARSTVRWDGRDARGQRVGRGVLFVRVDAAPDAWTQRIVF